MLAVAQSILILAALGIPMAALAADGDGTVTVSPTTAVAGSTGNTFTFVYTTGASWSSGANVAHLRITVPGGGWSAPTTAAGTGHVAISAETCPGTPTIAASSSNIDISGTNSNCNSGDTVTITYSATAGTTVGANTFTSLTRTNGSSGTLTAIASSPVVTLSAGVKVDTTTTITSHTPSPSVVGSPVSVGIGVARASGSGTPGGSVTVSDGSVTSAPCTLSGSGGTATASCSLTPSSTGVKTLTAAYGGDASFNGSAGTVSHTVNGVDGTGTVAIHWDPVGGYSYADPTVTPGMSLELIDFNFTATAAMAAGSQVAITIPAGWTAPTIADSPGVLAINPTTPALTTPACALPTAGTPQTAVSGSGPWTITIDVTCAAGSTFRVRWGNTLANQITAPGPGTYVFTTQSKGPGGTLTDIPAPQPTITIGKCHQAALVLTGTSSPATYGSTQTLGTTGGSGTGAVTYTSTTPSVCTTSGNTLSIISGTGTCSVYATKAADSNYNAATSATVNITAQKANQAALVITGTSSPATYGSTQTLGTTGGSGTGAVSYSTGASTACSVVGNVLTITASSGSCSVTATKAGDPNYNATSSSTVAITPAKAVLTVTPDPQSRTYGQAAPAYTFSVTGFAPGENAGTAAGYVAPACTSAYTPATPVASSPLTITCSGGSATNYTFSTTATALLTIGKANQAALVLTGTSSPATYGSTQTLGTTGGSGTGAVTYTSTTPSVCTTSGNTLSIISGTGTCSVYATKAADSNYNAATSATVNITAQKANQAALVITGTSSPATYGSTQTLGTTGGSGTGAVSYSTGASTACSVVGNVLTITASSGSCSVTATKAGDPNYNATSSSTVAITPAKAVLTVTPDPQSRTYGQAAPAYTFSVTGFAPGENAGTAAGYVAPACTSAYTPATPVASSPLTITCSGGSATNYTFSTTATALLTIGKANQAALVITGTSSPATYGSTQTLGTTGGSGTGAVSYSTGASTACSVVGNVLTITASSGSCSVTATKAGDPNYNATSSSTVAITPAKAVLTVTPDPQSRTYGQAAPAYTFSVTGFAPGENAGTAAGYVAPACTSAYTPATPVASSPLTITCSGGSATNYTFSTTATALLTIGKANQAALVITSPAAATYGDAPFTPTTSGGSGVGSVTFTTSTPSVCTAIGSATVTIVGAGTCTITATKAGDANYNATTSAPYSLDVALAASTTTVTCPASVVYDGTAQEPCTVSVTGSGGLSLTPTAVYGANTDAGTATASYSYPGDATHGPSSDSTTFDITKADPVCAVSGYSGTYDGSAHGASGSCTGVLAETLSGLSLGSRSPTSRAAPPTGPSPTSPATTPTTRARSASRSPRPTRSARSAATAARMTARPTVPRAAARASSPRPSAGSASARRSPTSRAAPPTGPSPTSPATTPTTRARSPSRSPRQTPPPRSPARPASSSTARPRRRAARRSRVPA